MVFNHLSYKCGFNSECQCLVWFASILQPHRVAKAGRFNHLSLTFSGLLHQFIHHFKLCRIIYPICFLTFLFFFTTSSLTHALLIAGTPKLIFKLSQYVDVFTTQSLHVPPDWKSLV